MESIIFERKEEKREMIKNLYARGRRNEKMVKFVIGKSRLLFSSTSLRSNKTPRALFRENLSVLESK